jgi:hypothetical protein
MYNLAHFPINEGALLAMKIDPLVFSARFPDRCRLELCGSRCCRFGVWADVAERDAIVASRDLFTPYLRPEAADPESWFGATNEDGDCPSGLAVETMAVKGYCAFFNPACGCVLQKAAADAGLHEWHLKPRFCIMFPLVLLDGELTVDEDMKSLWCMREKNRTRPILHAVDREVRYLFGERVARSLGRKLKGCAGTGRSAAAPQGAGPGGRES